MAEYSAAIARTEAMRLADQGFIPIALHAGTKKPIADKWEQTPLPTHAQIKGIWSDEARYNIGVRTGDDSNHLQALDFDIYESYSQWMSDYNAPKTKVVWSYRGPSPMYRIVGGDTLSGKMRGDAGDLLGNKHQRVWTPSVVTTKKGTLYNYWTSDDPIADLPADHPALLALIKQIEQKEAEKASGSVTTRRTDKKVSRLAKAYAEGRINTFGGHYSSKSELDAAVILSLYQSGFDADGIYAKMAASTQDSHWHAYKRDSDRMAEIERIIRKAGDTNSKQWNEAMRRADALRDFRTSHVWKGRYHIPGTGEFDEETGKVLSRPKFATGSAIEAVLLAHEAKVRDCGDYQYSLDVRAGDGRFANMGRLSFQPAQKFIHKTGIIQLVKPMIGSCSNLYELNRAKEMASLDIPQIEKKHKSETTSSQLCSTAPHNCDEVVSKLCVFESGVFEYRALGRSASLIYRTCLDAPMTTEELSEATGRHINTVRSAIAKLLQYGLVEKTGTKYQSDANVNWAALGEFLASDRIVKRRKEIHTEQRTLRAKKWKESQAETPAADLVTASPVAPEVPATPVAPAPAPAKALNHYDREVMPNKRQRNREKVY